MIRLPIHKNTIVFFILILFSVALRFFSFFPSVLDHDESTYLIIGRDILNGKALYTDVTDTKPVGIFLLYAGLEYLFGSSIFLKRLVFAVLVGLTGFLIHLVAKKIFKQNKVAFASAIIYIIYVSIWNYHGRSPNTELVFNFFTVGSLLLFLKPGIRNYFFAGLLMGIGFIVKYLVLFDFIAFLLFFFIYEMIKKENRKDIQIWIRFIVAGLAFLIPFGLTNLYFWRGVNFQDFYFITYQLPGNYGSNPSLIRYFTMLLDFTAKFLPVSFMVFYVIFKKEKPLEQKFKLFFLLWIVSVLIAIYIPGKEFSHYTIQLMLPFSFLAGLFFHPEFRTDKITRQVYSRKYGRIAMASILLVIQFIGFQNEFMKSDYEREVADYLAEKMGKNDTVFVSNYQQIIYYLLELESPSKFVHSNLLFSETYKAFNINAEEEIRRIIDENPRFVLYQNKNEVVQQLIQNKYSGIKEFNNGKIKLFELNP